jgi:FtsP/CotA-like multicopper oxidase with cupredoxin domain
VPPDRRSRPPLSPARRTLWLVLVSLAVAVAASVPLRGILPTDELDITDVGLHHHDGQLTITAELAGGARSGTRLRLWYTLTPAGASTGSAPVYRSATHSGTYLGDGSVVTGTDAIEVPPGEYRIDVWLHAKRRATFIHYARASAAIDLRGVQPNTWRPRPAETLEVDLADLTLTGAGASWLAGTVRVVNHTAAARSTTVAVGLLPDGAPVTGDDAVRWLRTYEVDVAPLDEAEVVVDVVPTPPAGRYRVLAEVQVDGRTLDRVAAGAAVQLGGGPVERRRAQARADVTVIGLAVAGEAEPGEQLVVAVELANTTDRLLLVRSWWVLDPPGATDGPHLAEGRRSEVPLGPGERTTVLVAGRLPREVGRFDLSAVAHVVTGDGTGVHSDQGWVPDGLTLR